MSLAPAFLQPYPDWLRAWVYPMANTEMNIHIHTFEKSRVTNWLKLHKFVPWESLELEVEEKATQAQDEHADSAQKGSSQPVSSNEKPSCWEVTVWPIWNISIQAV